MIKCTQIYKMQMLKIFPFASSIKVTLKNANGDRKILFLYITVYADDIYWISEDFPKNEIEKINVYLLLLYKKIVNFCHRNIQRLTPAVFYIKKMGLSSKEKRIAIIQLLYFWTLCVDGRIEHIEQPESIYFGKCCWIKLNKLVKVKQLDIFCSLLHVIHFL